MTEISEEILHRCLCGTASDTDLQTLAKWLGESEENASYYFDMERTADFSELHNRNEGVRMEVALARLKKRISVNEKLHGGNGRGHVASLIWKIAGVAAMLAIVGVLAFRFMVWEAPKVVFAAGNKMEQLELPDGSSVWLKPGSEIAYAEEFATNREMELKGEAYFEVKHDPEHPFQVKGEEIMVKVLGTKFTFLSRDSKSESFVSLVEGSVKVSKNADGESLVLTPGQRAVYQPTNKKLALEDADTRLDAVWHDFNIPFSNATINEIALTLEKLYGVDVKVSPNVDKKSTYSGSVYLYDGIDTTLGALALTVPIRYRVANGEVWISPR